MPEDIVDYRELFLSGRPMLDTRAPVEFAKGAFPEAVNIPLMNDVEREQLGLRYKQQGQDAAIALGHQLVGGETKAARIQAWADFARANPDGCLYCFRGGMRSRIARQWLKDEAGIDYLCVAGGYKAMRGFLLETVEQAVAECGFLVVGGMTGSGKTDVVRQLKNGLDLEGHANHRGSSFGKRPTAQPSSIDFENRLAIDVLKKRAQGVGTIVLEYESRLIGRCALPSSLHQGMQRFPVIWLEEEVEARIERVLRDYVIGLSAEYAALQGAAGHGLFGAHLQSALEKLRKRLGDERHRRAAGILAAALAAQADNGEVDLHRDWIGILLREYYDPIYRYQRENKDKRIEFAGGQAAVLDYLRARA